MSRPTVILSGKVVGFKKGTNEETQRHWSYIDLLTPGETSIIRVFQVPTEYESQKGKYLTFAAVASVKGENLNFSYKGEVLVKEDRIDLADNQELEATVDKKATKTKVSK
jgi:hypothetical protein